MQLINESNVLESGHYQNTNCKGKNDEMSLCMVVSSMT